MGIDPEAFRPGGGNYEGGCVHWLSFQGEPSNDLLARGRQRQPVVAVGLKKLGTVEVQSLPFFDTVKVKVADAHAISDAANKLGLNLRVVDSSTITVSFDETTTLEDVDKLFKAFALSKPQGKSPTGVNFHGQLCSHLFSDNPAAISNCRACPQSQNFIL